MTTEAADTERSIAAITEIETGRAADRVVGRRDARSEVSSRNAWFAVLAVAGIWAVGDAVARPELVNSGGWSVLAKFFSAATRPELDDDFLRVVARASATTAAYAFVGTAISLMIGIIGGIVASETWWQRDPLARSRAIQPFGWLAARTFGAVPRGVHEAVWGLVLLRVLGLDPWVAILAVAIPYGAITAKVVAESVDDEAGDAYRAYRAAGAPRLAAIAYGIAPTILSDVVSYGLYRLECAIRSSVVLGMVGAGGLGFELANSFESLRYEQIWTLLAALAMLAAAADWWGASLRRRPTRRRVRISVAVVVLATVAGLVHLRVDPAHLVRGRARALAARLGRDAWPPKLPTDGWSALARATIDTAQLSIIAISFATLVGVPLAYAAARADGSDARPSRRALGLAARSLLLFLRCVPPPVWALLVLFVVFPGPLTGGLALGLYTLGVVGRLDAEAIENSDREPTRVLRLAGASPVTAVAYGSLPIVTPRLVSLSMYRWEVAARETVIVGLVGAGGLGRLLNDQNVAFDEGAMLTSVVALIVMSLAIDLVSARVRAAIR